MKDNRPYISIDMDKLTKHLTTAVYARLRQFDRSFWIVSFGPWVHPYNRVPNCMALCIDGFIQYKFSMQFDKSCIVVFRVDKMPKDKKYNIILDVKHGDRLTLAALIQKISTAKVS